MPHAAQRRSFAHPAANIVPYGLLIGLIGFAVWQGIHTI
jgi:hypothetical protein